MSDNVDQSNFNSNEPEFDEILLEQKAAREKNRIVKKWVTELKLELKLNISQGHELLELKERVETMLKNISQSLEISQENLFLREKVKGTDKDPVEEFLLQEIEALRHSEEFLLSEELEKLNFQLYHLRHARNEIEVDIAQKKKINKNDECAKLLQTLVEELGPDEQLDFPLPEVSPNSTPTQWIPTTQALIKKSQDQRKSSHRIFTSVTQSMVKIANKCFGAWYDTNAAFMRRIQKLLEVKNEVDELLEKNRQEIRGLICQNDKIENYLDNKRQDLKAAQAKLNKKKGDAASGDLCRDKTLLELLREIHTLKTGIEALTSRQNKLDELLTQLNKTKATLEHDLKFKNVVLLTERDRCLALRQAFPISTFVETRFAKKGPVVVEDIPMIR